MTIRSIPATTIPPSPGTPHNLFSNCYSIQSAQGIKLLAHRHVNGLVVVALDPEGLPQSPLVAVEYKIQPVSAEISTGQKRKQNDLLLRGRLPSPIHGLVNPTDVLISLTTEDGAEIHLPCGVLGTILEINTRLTVELLQKDPLLKGYLAIFLPAGDFPPGDCE